MNMIIDSPLKKGNFLTNMEIYICISIYIGMYYIYIYININRKIDIILTIYKLIEELNPR